MSWLKSQHSWGSNDLWFIHKLKLSFPFLVSTSKKSIPTIDWKSQQWTEELFHDQKLPGSCHFARSAHRTDFGHLWNAENLQQSAFAHLTVASTFDKSPSKRLEVESGVVMQPGSACQSEKLQWQTNRPTRWSSDWKRKYLCSDPILFRDPLKRNVFFGTCRTQERETLSGVLRFLFACARVCLARQAFQLEQELNPKRDNLISSQSGCQFRTGNLLTSLRSHSTRDLAPNAKVLRCHQPLPYIAASMGGASVGGGTSVGVAYPCISLGGVDLGPYLVDGWQGGWYPWVGGGQALELQFYFGPFLKAAK